ncbi:MAG: bioD [Pedosphaera sp.]|nr:bioD [Pedosphaera sp.]
MSASKQKIIFVTGTDTDVGKTLFTALLLHHLRQKGCHALAMKPFCSGSRADVNLLQSLQSGELSDAEMNPFYFAEPIAPLVAAKKQRKTIRLKEVVARIKKIQAKSEVLLIEGSGGLLVPLGKDFDVADLIQVIDCQVVVIARNRLGTINHTMLTVNALQAMGKPPIATALMSAAKPDLTSRTNAQVLATLLRPINVLEIPFLGKQPLRTTSVKENALKIHKTLATIARSSGFLC